MLQIRARTCRMRDRKRNSNESGRREEKNDNCTLMLVCVLLATTFETDVACATLFTYLSERFPFLSYTFQTLIAFLVPASRGIPPEHSFTLYEMRANADTK